MLTRPTECRTNNKRYFTSLQYQTVILNHKLHKVNYLRDFIWFLFTLTLEKLKPIFES